MPEATLPQILQAREERVQLQQQLIRTYHCPLICFTMNIAGPVKTSPLIERAFFEGLHQLEARLPQDKIRARKLDIAVTGCQIILAVDMDTDTLKSICVSIEEATPLGRLFDMDVLGVDCQKIDRHSQRGCLVCGAEGRGCASRRLHNVEELQAATHRILHDHFAAFDRETIASLAVQSLLDEVYTTPKPGLVDRRNSGSHRDMNLSSFEASAEALRSYFYECVALGQATADSDPCVTFPLLRRAGLVAEQAMFKATGGVNTHKGAIFTLGCLCGSIGRLWSADVPFAPIEAILADTAQIGQAAMETDFAAKDTSTAGLKLYHTCGITGIRGEVAGGLPAIAQCALPLYKSLLQEGVDKNHAGVVTLLHLIATVNDTTLYRRGGQDGAAYAVEAARELLKAERIPSLAEVEKLDDAFIARNLSAGGCADLLAATYFLYEVQHL